MSGASHDIFEASVLPPRFARPNILPPVFSVLPRLTTTAKLARWLGPWAGNDAPNDVSREIVEYAQSAAAPGDRVRAHVYQPRGPVYGTYLVLPGLHFLGPDDPRLDRFCRALATSGLLVVAPFIRSYTSLLIDRSAFKDAETALDLARRESQDRGLGEPAVFSISFGSMLALHLASRPSPPRAALLFGGYAEFEPTVRFALTGRTLFDGSTLELTRDPLNSPVVYLHLLEHLEIAGERETLARAWREMVYQTWGKMELKQGDARAPIARAIAETLPDSLREPFFMGCGLAEGGLGWAESGFERARRDLAFLDPTDALRNVRCPVTVVHGREDDVIPYVESVKLARSLPSRYLRGLHLTGLYSHTGTSQTKLGALVGELRALTSLLLDLAGGPFVATPNRV